LRTPAAAEGIYGLFLPIFVTDQFQMFKGRIVILDPALNIAQRGRRLLANALGMILFVEIT